MNTCNKKHRHFKKFELLPIDQGGEGRHKCCGCAYQLGFEKGIERNAAFNFNVDSLPESQAGSVRHKSPHAAFALGYQDGVTQSYA